MTLYRIGSTSRRPLAALIVAIILICVATLISSAPAEATSDLVGSWRMDEGSGTLVADGSGNNLHGTLSNPAIWGSGDTACGSALQFDGSSAVTVLRDPALEPVHLTLQAMVKAPVTPGTYRYIAGKSLTNAWASYALYTGGVGGLAFYIGGGTTFAITPSASAPTIWDGEWHHVVGSYDGSAVRLYIDGIEVGVTPTTLPIVYGATTDFTIGHDPLGHIFEHHFVGAIDAVKLWNRALTAAEIQQLDPCAPDVPPNTLPSAAAGGPYDGSEGSAIPLSGASAVDPDGDPLSYTWTVDSAVCTFDDATALNPALTCQDDGAFNVNLLVDDGQATADSSAGVTVINLPPAVGPISAPLAPVSVNSEISLSATFSDPGVFDAHTAIWEWGDLSNSPANVTSSAGAGIAVGDHSYTAPGVYTINLTVTDDDGDEGESALRYIVVYDPDGGFVTGAGWIDSPPGACLLPAECQSTSGRANFGFVSRYENGASVPTGNTQFSFKAGDLRFHSSEYDWLVVTGGSYARFKGVGTINGHFAPGGEPYKFQIWAGDTTGSGNADTFRIKIWVEQNDSETVIYDNGMDQTLGGGNIRIHDH